MTRLPSGGIESTIAATSSQYAYLEGLTELDLSTVVLTRRQASTYIDWILSDNGELVERAMNRLILAGARGAF